MRLSAAAVSDVGPYRSANQDSAFTASWGAAVADGVGGGPAGDLASAALLHRLVAEGPLVADADALRTRIRLANWDLRAHGERDSALRGMSTTLTGLFGTGSADTVLLAHTGDSRGYRVRDGLMTRMTRDDSYVQELLEHGLVSAAEAVSHPRRNLITASLRGDDDDVVRVSVVDARAGDRWLLCSDGVTDYVPEAMFAELLLGVAAQADAADAIVRLAISAGSQDNITAVVCDVRPGRVAGVDGPVFSGAAAARFCEGLAADALLA